MKYKTTQKDRYGNMRSLEIDTGEKNMEVPPMTSSIPQYEAVGGLAENHPGEPKGSDTVPAWLTPGEFVVNKEATDLFGPQIKQMNDIGREIQDGNISPSEASQIPMYASSGKAAKEYPAEKKLANQIAIYEHLKSRGLSDKAAAGLMAQIQHESAGTFDYQWQEHSGGGGHGLFQMDPNPGGWLGPYKQWLRKKYMDDLNKMELEPVVPGGPVLNPTMQFDSPQNQLDFAIDLYTNPNAIPHPTDPGHYFIGDQNAASIRSVLGNPNVDLTEMSNILVDTWINPKEKIKYPENRINRQEDTQAMWDLIQSGAFIGAQDPSAVPIIMDTVPNVTEDGLIVKDIPRPLTSNQSLGDAVMDKVQGGINVVRDRAGNVIDWIGNTATGIHNQLHPTQEEMGWKNKGGPIYAYDGIQIPLTRGGGKPWWETVNLFPWSGNQVKTEYTSRHPGAGGSPAVPSIPNTVDHGFQQALKGKILNQVDSYNPQGLGGEEAAVPNNEWDINDLGIRDDSTSMTNEDWGSSGIDLSVPPKFPEFYRPADAPAPDYGEAPTWEMRYDNTQPFTSNYDKYVQEEIAGTPAYSIPPVVPPIPVSDWNADPNKITPPMPVVPSSGGPPAGAYIGGPSSLGLDPDAYDQETGDLLSYPPSNLEAEATSMIGVKPDMSENDVLMSLDLEQSRGAIKSQIAMLEGQLKTAYNDLKSYQLSGGDKEGEVLFRNNIRSIENQLADKKKTQALIDFRNKVAPDIEASKQKIKDDNKIIALQEIIDSKETTETEKIIAAKEINELGGETTEEKAKKAAEKKLSDLANNVDDNLNNAINNDLNSADGKKATEDAENKDDNDPEKSKARKMFDFLFGDLIDQGEIGRAIAVYLGSRAMGYDHGSSIGYVARQYLTRIDKKNAAFKKWMLENVGKYQPSSIEKFKKTGNPNHLIPIGAKPRSQGNSKMMYHPDLRSEGMAYEFKVKNSQGEDETFWSFDPTGKNDKLRVGVGWTDKNVLDVGTEEINLVKDMLVGMQNKIDKEVTGKKDNKRTKYWSSNSDVPGLIPAAAAGEVAQWLHERDIPPGKYQTAIAEAYTALINSNKRKVKELGDKAVIESSLIPYLQEATVKVRLEDMTFINEEGKTELIPSPAVAMLDGKKRVMNTKLLVDLEKKIDMVFPAGTADRFWAQAAQSWIKDADVRKEFIASAKTKEFKEYTPFALWAEYLLQSEIERAAKETAQ